MEETTRPTKRQEESRSVMTHLLMPGHMNQSGTLFGGQLLSWIDMLAGIVALRHADRNVVTVSIDHLDFQCSARSSDVITLEGKVTWTGNTSMEVKIETWKENQGGKKILINTAYLVMVAIDNETGKSISVPRLLIETEEQQAEWDAAVLRGNIRKYRKNHNL